MAQVPKIDSNITGLAYAEEAQLGILPGEQGLGGTPDWRRLEPNSYSDFGGEIVTVAPNPINPSRQRRKGVTTDLNASGGFNHNLSYRNLGHLMQGMMFASVRRKGRFIASAVTASVYTVPASTGAKVGSILKGAGFANSANNALKVATAITGTSISAAGLVAEASPPATAVLDVVGFESAVGDIKVDTTAGLPALTSTTLDFTTLGLVPGQWIFIGGDTTATRFANALNNGYKRVRSVTANRVVLDKSYQTMVTDAGAGVGIRLFFGDVLRNETGALIVRRSYNVERMLGAPDNALPNQIQSEIIKGAVPNEFTLNIPSAELVNVDFSFVAIDNEQREGTIGPKQVNVRSPLPSKEYNSSSDIRRIRLSPVSQVDAAPLAMFAYVTEANLTINNNVTPNKAVGVLGAFDVTAGTFMVSGELTAYFSDVRATQAVRNNADVTLDICFAKDNLGMIYDLPLVALGDGRLNIEIDEPITLPLQTEAASGQDVDQALDHTLLITYFNYLPAAGM